MLSTCGGVCAGAIGDDSFSGVGHREEVVAKQLLMVNPSYLIMVG